MPLFGKRKPKAPRPHPYKDEVTSEAEKDPAKFAVLWFMLATSIVVAGSLLNSKFSNHYGGGAANWVEWSYVPLFLGLVLIGTHFLKQPWTHHTTMAGWLFFGFYWALVAQDQSDVANFLFAAIGAYLSSYVAYHEWLDLKRGVRTLATKFLATATFIAAGTYFMIAAIVPFRIGLINIVGGHTKWMLDLVGAGEEKGIVFLVDKTEILGPVMFFYPDTYCDPYRTDDVGKWCKENGHDVLHTNPETPTNWFQEMLQYSPGKDEFDYIVPVSIILACTAIQSIMLFVGLFYGTNADWKKKLTFSLVIGALIYVLNLFRNTIIIWFYGLGHASFWFIHDIVGKGLSLLALVGIAAVAFRKFPEFFEALGSVLDMIHRDGPIERAFRFGRRRPNLDGSPRAVQHPLRREPMMVAFLSLITLNLYAWAWSKNWLKSLDKKTFEARKTLISLSVALLLFGAFMLVQGAFSIVSWEEIGTWDAFRANSSFFYGTLAIVAFQIITSYQVYLVSKAAGQPLPAAMLGVVPGVLPLATKSVQAKLEADLDWEEGKYGPTYVVDGVDGSINDA